jgi:hypothetical protein
MKEAVVQHEHLILRIIAFDTTADLPHAYLLNVAKQLRLENEEVKYAWMFMNDSFRDKRVIFTPPAVLACACLHLGMIFNSKGANGDDSGGTARAIDRSDLLPSSEDGDDEESFLAKWWGLYGIDNRALAEAAEWISSCSLSASK